MPEGLEHSGLCCGFVATDPSFPARYPKGLSSLDPSPAGPGGKLVLPTAASQDLGLPPSPKDRCRDFQAWELGIPEDF